MTAPALFSGHFFSALGWALFHFLWQGTLVAGIVAGLGVLLAKRSPAIRYVVACAGLATMLALPVATAWSLAAVGHWERSAAVGGPSANVAPFSRLSAPGLAAPEGFIPRTIAIRVEAARPWALSVWFAGVLALSLRFLGGLRTANRLTRRGARPAAREWQQVLSQLAARLSITRPVRLLESAVVKIPIAIGAFRPAILLPASIFTGLPPRGLEALIAHELAHIRRQDYLVNLLQAVAETLLFYHPAVWWVSARIRTEREQCCDDLAISATGDARSYARALVRIEEMRGATSALAVAAGGGNLWKRVVRLLRDEPASAESPSGWLAGAVALALLFVLGAAARVRPSGSIEGDDFGSGRALVSEPAPADVVVRAPAASPKSTGRHSGREAPDSDSNCKPVASPPRLGALSGEALVALRDHGVTGDFVRAVASLGYDRAEPDEILALKIHGVTPEDIAEMNRIFGKRPLDEHVAFKIHGVTADSVRRLSVLGLGKLSPNDVVAMRIHGVTPDLVRDIRSLGYTDPSPDDLVALRIHRVSVESIRKANARAGRLLPLDELIERRCEKDRDEK